MCEYDYCECGSANITSGFDDDFGYWDTCVKCGKRKYDGYHFYDHYDGRDHEMFYLANGDIYVEGEDDD